MSGRSKRTPREQTIEIAALSIAANPHPQGIYIRLLNAASAIVVNARGPDFAKISKPIPNKDNSGVYTGRIHLWTEIDVKGKWFDTSQEDTLPASLKRGINIPDNAKPNYRVFSYVFEEKKHRLYFETRNESHNRLGPSVARRIFNRLLGEEPLWANVPDVSVTVVPRRGAVKAVLELPGLRSLKIRLVLPNPDETPEEVRRRTLKRLRDANAKQLDENYIKKAGASRLIATKEIQELAEVASESGEVVGVGRRDDGSRVEQSTEGMPRIETISMEAGNSFLGRILGSVGLF